MTWSRMRFKSETVWVRMNHAGQPALDAHGRAEMKYHPDDTRLYRPSSVNLTPLDPAEAALEPPPAKAPRRATRSPEGGGAGHEPAAAGAVNVWTDGACSGNPGPMGIGVVVLLDGKRIEHGEYLGVGTNNIAELVAIERGLQLATEGGRDAGRAIRVHTDSSYSIGVLTKAWKAKANQELIARLRKMLVGLPQVRMVKVAGHAGVPENERCDQLAREAVSSGR